MNGRRIFALGKVLLWTLVMAVCGAHAASTQSSWQGTVTYVTDGDTLRVRPQGEGEPRNIRVHGIDAPEICQLYGKAARAALTAYLLGQRVQVGVQRVDQYGRLLARITLQGQDVGAWMVTQGHAWSYRYRRDAGPYAAQESQARAQGRGLFASTDAEQPRDFRKRHGSCH
jgi:endonuclease YncB( thermonuclease family)